MLAGGTATDLLNATKARNRLKPTGRQQYLPENGSETLARQNGAIMLVGLSSDGRRVVNFYPELEGVAPPAGTVPAGAYLDLPPSIIDEMREKSGTSTILGAPVVKWISGGPPGATPNNPQP